MSGPWISDEREDPPVPLGLNEMTIPRAAILGSLGTIAILLLSAIWVGWGAYVFLGQLDGAFSTIDESSLQDDGRWTWEVMLLYDTCMPREDADGNSDWEWPDNLSAQDEPFWLPGELSCEWRHQGVNDRAVIAVNNAGNTTLSLKLSVESESVSITHPSSGILEIEPDTAEVFAIRLDTAVTEETFVVRVAHATVEEAVVELEVNLLSDTERDSHIAPGNRLNVHYQVWIYDTNENLDEGDLPATAGEDPMCEAGAPSACYIKGFHWGLVGLDCDIIGNCIGLGSGPTHTVLLPPELAYKDRPDNGYNDQWFLFELRLINRIP